MNRIQDNGFIRSSAACEGPSSLPPAQGEIAQECINLENLITRLNEAVDRANSRLYSVLRNQTGDKEKNSIPGESPRVSSTDMGLFLEGQNYRLQAAIGQILTLIDRVEL